MKDQETKITRGSDLNTRKTENMDEILEFFDEKSNSNSVSDASSENIDTVTFNLNLSKVMSAE